MTEESDRDGRMAEPTHPQTAQIDPKSKHAPHQTGERPLKPTSVPQNTHPSLANLPVSRYHTYD